MAVEVRNGKAEVDVDMLTRHGAHTLSFLNRTRTSESATPNKSRQCLAIKQKESELDMHVDTISSGVREHDS